MASLLTPPVRLTPAPVARSALKQQLFDPEDSVTYVGQSARAVPRPDLVRPSRVKDVVAAYVGLTKPRVIELLLLTTVPVMFFAARGVPELGLVVATVIG